MNPLWLIRIVPGAAFFGFLLCALLTANREAEIVARELLRALRDILDAFWDMSPLQYASSRGLPFMSDAIGEEIKERGRAAIHHAEEELR